MKDRDRGLGPIQVTRDRTVALPIFQQSLVVLSGVLTARTHPEPELALWPKKDAWVEVGGYKGPFNENWAPPLESWSGKLAPALRFLIG